MSSHSHQPNAGPIILRPASVAHDPPTAAGVIRPLNSAERLDEICSRERQHRVDSLGDSERFVLQMILIGMRDREIGVQQGVSAGAIAARRRRLLKKLGANNAFGSALKRRESRRATTEAGGSIHPTAKSRSDSSRNARLGGVVQ